MVSETPKVVTPFRQIKIADTFSLHTRRERSGASIQLLTYHQLTNSRSPPVSIIPRIRD